MSLLTILSRCANRLGLIHIAEPKAAAQAAVKVPMRTLRLSELTSHIRAEEVRSLAQLPAEMSVAFDRVYEAAGVTAAPHGWTVMRLIELLHTDQYRKMDRQAAQQAILGVLVADKAPPEDVIKHAVACDEALDAYETFIRRKMEDRTAARHREIEALRSRILELQDQCARLEEQFKMDSQQFEAWRRRKRAAEDELAMAVGYLVEEALISREGD
jgi:hypothetical protein